MTVTESKGSKQYRSVVVPYRPGRKPAIIAAFVALLIIVAVASAWYGARTIEAGYRQLYTEREQLSQQLSETSFELAAIEQKLANASVGAEVDRLAADEVRMVILEQKESIAGLKEEISFYKGLMAPSEREKGLSIRGWEVYPTADSARYQFKLVVQQLALKHLLMAGYVNVVILGSTVDESDVEVPQSYSLAILSEQIEDENIKLRFKYFQTIEGELRLPEGFKPERVSLLARVSKPKYVQIEKNYSWSAPGS
jgi:hypothetical protein